MDGVTKPKRTWHSGSPPEIGWWPASMEQDPNCLRWWNGKHWSVTVFSEEKAKAAADWALWKSCNQDEIQWCARWWL